MDHETHHNRIFAVVFLLVVLGLGIGALVLKARYDITGEPDMQYWSQSSDTDEEHPFESSLIANFPGKYVLVDINGRIRNALGIREMNGVTKLMNGYLAELQPEIPEEDLIRRADKVAALSQALEEQGIPFLYVATPVKVDETNPLLPEGTTDYDNENINVFLAELDAQGTPYMDLRKEWRDRGMDHYENFYRTDHHWTTEGGFASYQIVEAWLTDALSAEIDPYVTKRLGYIVSTYEGIHLGSRGRRTGEAFAGGADDFAIIMPRFTTRIMNMSTGEHGTFDGMLVHREALEERNLMMTDVYDEVFSSAMGDYVNELAWNDKTILFIEDSFGNAMNPYMVMAFHRVVSMNSYDPTRLREVIAGLKPDAVVLMQCGLTNLASDANYEFGY